MKTSLYLLPNRIGLKFEQSADRDLFWNSMSDGARLAAERIGNRTIRFRPDRFQDKNGLIIPLTGNGTGPVAIASKPAPPPPAKPPPSNIVNVGTGSDPFAITGNAVKALPGMVAVQSNIAPGMPQEASGGIQTPPTAENASTVQGDAVAPSQEAPEPKPEAEKADPEPKDRRTKAWRMWKLKQIEREKS